MMRSTDQNQSKKRMSSKTEAPYAMGAGLAGETMEKEEDDQPVQEQPVRRRRQEDSPPHPPTVPMYNPPKVTQMASLMDHQAITDAIHNLEAKEEAHSKWMKELHENMETHRAQIIHVRRKVTRGFECSNENFENAQARLDDLDRNKVDDLQATRKIVQMDAVVAELQAAMANTQIQIGEYTEKMEQRLKAAENSLEKYTLDLHI